MIFRSTLEKLELAAVALIAMVEPAAAEAKPVSIHGNGWVAVMILLVFVAVIYFLVIGPLKIEERDARLRRRADDGEHGWFGTSGHTHHGDDDDESNSN
jgi:hypothetical protein